MPSPPPTQHRLHSYLVHGLVFASRAYFDSPRGRWAVRLLCEAFVLYIYHAVQLFTGAAAKAACGHS